MPKFLWFICDCRCGHTYLAERALTLDEVSRAHEHIADVLPSFEHVGLVLWSLTPKLAADAAALGCQYEGNANTYEQAQSFARLALRELHKAKLNPQPLTPPELTGDREPGYESPRVEVVDPKHAERLRQLQEACK